MNSSKKNINSFLIYGIHPVISALNNINRLKKNLYITSKNHDLFKQFANIVKINIIDKEDFRKLFKENTLHQEVALEVHALNHQLEDILKNAQEKSLIIILDQVQDPHNVGAILRTAAAFNASAVINTIHNSPGETGIIAKTASGGLDIIPYINVTNISKTIQLLKDNGYWIYGLDGAAKGGMPKDFAEKSAIVLGTEEVGIRKLVKENCDMLCKIPMPGNMESLNVSNAAAISMFCYLSNFDKF